MVHKWTLLLPIRKKNCHVTTRPDTLCGVTLLVIAPRASLIEQVKGQIENMDDIYGYQEQSKKKTEFERVQLARKRRGVEIKGIHAINP